MWGLGPAVVVLALACASGVQPPGLPAPLASPDSIESVVFLVGDAGGPVSASQPVLSALSREAARAPSRSTILFLGDNIYPRGIPDSTSPDRAEAVRRLEAQIQVVSEPTRGIFIPGNHDWAKHGDDGWEAIRRQAQLVTRGGATVSFLPADGCPGPSIVDLGRRLRLVVLDTQWWLHGGPKPIDPTSTCPADSPGEVVDSIRSALRGAGDRQVAVIAHHPLASAGPHGGFFPWQDHLFPLRVVASWLWLPLPILGSAYPLARRSGISDQDQSSGENRRMRLAIESALAERPPLIYASGHEHLLEVRTGGAAKYLLVSGSGQYNHSSPARRSSSTRFLERAAGFMRLDVMANGRIRLSVLAADREGQAGEVFSLWLE